MATTADNSFGQLLKRWRSQRNFSQLNLSLASDVSQRHISFLESGRAKPSREMIVKLSSVLDIPLRQRNKLLSSAGFAPIYSELDLSDPEVAPIRRALEFMLKQQTPYPAFVIDRYWNQIMANESALRFLQWLVGERKVPEAIGPNLVKLMLHPQGVKSQVEDWEIVASHLVRRIHREVTAEGEDVRSQSLFNEILSYPDVKDIWQSPLKENWQHPILNTTFLGAKERLSFFTTLTTLGTPQDITLQELRLECLFPADRETEAHFSSKC